MRIYNIHDAKTHLSKLVQLAADGESFVIAKAGKPLVKVVPISAPEPEKMKRIGIWPGAFEVPDNFDQMGSQEIAEMFGTL